MMKNLIFFIVALIAVPTCAAILIDHFVPEKPSAVEWQKITWADRR